MTQSRHEHDYAHEQALELLSLDAPQEDEGEKTEILCPHCIISAKPQGWNDIGHVEFLRLKDGRYVCPACGAEWNMLNDVMTTFIEGLIDNSQAYDMYTALRRKVKGDLKDLSEAI